MFLDYFIVKQSPPALGWPPATSREGHSSYGFGSPLGAVRLIDFIGYCVRRSVTVDCHHPRAETPSRLNINIKDDSSFPLIYRTNQNCSHNFNAETFDFHSIPKNGAEKGDSGRISETIETLQANTRKELSGFVCEARTS